MIELFFKQLEKIKNRFHNSELEIDELIIVFIGSSLLSFVTFMILDSIFDSNFLY